MSARNSRFGSSWFWLTSVAVSAAIVNQEAKSAAPSVVPAAMGDVQLIVKFIPDTVPKDKPAILQIQIKNNSAKEVGFTTTTFVHDYSISFKQASGKEVAFTEFGKKLAEATPFSHIQGVSIKPVDGIYSYGINLRDFYDLNIPGIYKITISLKVSDSEGHQLDLKSNETSVTIQ